jgi:hypothetical protein
MNNQRKIFLVIIILLLSFFRTLTDVFKKIKFPTYKHVTNDKDRETYYNYDNFKRFLDIPIVVLSFILLWNIKLNITIYFFTFILLLNLAIDYIFAIRNNNPTQTQLFIDKYISLWADVLLNISITYILYKLFQFK